MIYWLIKSFILLLFLLPVVTGAEAGYIQMVGIPNLDTSQSITTGEYLNALYTLSIGLAAILAVLRLIYAGAQYILSDIITSKEQAKKDIFNAILGLMIVLSAVLILKTINVQLVNLDILADLPPAGGYGGANTGCGANEIKTPSGCILAEEGLTITGSDNTGTPEVVISGRGEVDVEGLVVRIDFETENLMDYGFIDDIDQINDSVGANITPENILGVASITTEDMANVFGEIIGEIGETELGLVALELEDECTLIGGDSVGYGSIQLSDGGSVKFYCLNLIP